MKSPVVEVLLVVTNRLVCMTCLVDFSEGGFVAGSVGSEVGDLVTPATTTFWF